MFVTYRAGNEPDLLAVYLFNYNGRPDLTQKVCICVCSQAHSDLYRLTVMCMKVSLDRSQAFPFVPHADFRASTWGIKENAWERCCMKV